MSEILLIDDDSVTNFINQTLIKKSFPNLIPLVFEEAASALEHINRANEDRTLIFLDIHMPDINGWEFIEILGRDHNLNLFSIHILSSSIDEADKSKALSSKYVKSFSSKPLTPEIIRKVIGGYLQQDESFESNQA